MPDTTARLALPVLLPAQAQKHVTHNEALQMLDGMVQLVLAGLGSTSPPAEPVPGALYALGVAASGAWAGQDGRLAQWSETGWMFLDPQDGWRARDLGGDRLVVFRGGAWEPWRPDLGQLEGVGCGATSQLSAERHRRWMTVTFFDGAGLRPSDQVSMSLLNVAGRELSFAVAVSFSGCCLSRSSSMSLSDVAAA